ncbi:hypothetical protein ACCAA_420016 [Candidatus Accumulibacter aalborgensis]|uniref:Uncharacterized protein n=1 Tax=Candidatus Accumulibacter aalborgensis TaxID=1860102 RepID=A0A1A8XQ65_9PROT|nr:hypothetical protein ACCAA_420016 [Candidatus Accumulibacter aalborgensis]
MLLGLASTGNTQHRQALLFYGMADGTICADTMNIARYHAMIFQCCMVSRFSKQLLCNTREYFALVLNMVILGVKDAETFLFFIRRSTKAALRPY